LITESEYDGTEEKLIPLRKMEEKTKQQAAEEARRQAEIEAISQQFWEENGMSVPGTSLAAEEIEEAPAVTFTNVQLIDEDGTAYASASFADDVLNITAELTIPDLNRTGQVTIGEPFTIRVNFVLAEYAKSLTIGGPDGSRVTISTDNRFALYKFTGPKPDLEKETGYAFHFDQKTRKGYVDIRLKQVDEEARNSSIKIHVVGTFGSGDPITGQGRVKLVRPGDKPASKGPQFPSSPPVKIPPLKKP
jgi:hypothetical protein